MTAEEEFEEWFRQQDPGPPSCMGGHHAWAIRSYCAKLGYLEAHNHQQNKIDRLKAILGDLVNSVEFLNPFDSGHPNIKLRIDLTKAKELLKEQP